MSKLLVLSEIDCSKFLNKNGIYPDEFYTDFMLFKNKAATFIDADVLILFAGSCHFSKRHVLDIVRTLQRRASNEKDNGIKSLTIFTDVFLPSINRYYKFQGSLSNISEYSGWKLVSKNSDIWSRVPRGIATSREFYFLTPFDKGDIEHLRQEYKSTTTTDEPLRDYIKKPNFSSISEI